MVDINYVDDCIFNGKVTHKRFSPFKNDFRYSLKYFWVDIRRKKDLFFFKFDKPSLLSFYDFDHGEIDRDKKISLFKYLQDYLKKQRIFNIDTIKVLCLPRILNYQFNPISVFVGYDLKKIPKALIFQVSNTFGERHSYVSKIEKKVFKSNKFFYVSPFFEVSGSYELKFKISRKSIHLIVIYKEKEKLIFFADFYGKSVELNNLNLLKLLIFKPFQNIKATLGIYFEALKLWTKGAIYYKKPKKPKKFFSKIK